MPGGGASAAGRPASARAWAVRVLVPGSPPTGTSVVTGALGGKPAVEAAFAFPENGLVVHTGQARAVAANVKTSFSAVSSVGRISIFDGEITARTVSGSVRAGETTADLHGAVVGLRALGKRVAKRSVALGH